MKYFIQIKNRDSDKIVKTIAIQSLWDYKVVKGLNPGDYYISGYFSRWTYDNSMYKSYSYSNSFAPFTLEAGSMIMLPVGFGIQLIKNENNNRSMRFLQYTGRDGILQQKVFAKIEEKFPEETAAWNRTGTSIQEFKLDFTNVLDNREISMTDLKGKVVVIDFWAIWCGPCISEIPNMKRIYELYKDEGVEFIGISLDEYSETVIQFCSDNGITWPQYCEENRIWDTGFSQSWGIKSIPTIFLIGKDGQIISRDVRGQLDTLIPRALAE